MPALSQIDPVNLVSDLSEIRKKVTVSPPGLAAKYALRVAALIAVAGLVAAGIGFWLLRQQTAAGQVLVLYGNVDIREINAAFNADGPVTRMLLQEAIGCAGAS